MPEVSTSGPCEAASSSPAGDPFSGRSCAALRASTTKNLGRKIERRKIALLSRALTSDEAVVTSTSQCYDAACLRLAIAVTRSRAMDRNATIGRLSVWSGGGDASLALATIPRRQATW